MENRKGKTNVLCSVLLEFGSASKIGLTIRIRSSVANDYALCNKDCDISRKQKDC
jgi:hypothetical protein